MNVPLAPPVALKLDPICSSDVLVLTAGIAVAGLMNKPVVPLVSVMVPLKLGLLTTPTVTVPPSDTGLPLTVRLLLLLTAIVLLASLAFVTTPLPITSVPAVPLKVTSPVIVLFLNEVVELS